VQQPPIRISVNSRLHSTTKVSSALHVVQLPESSGADLLKRKDDTRATAPKSNAIREDYRKSTTYNNKRRQFVGLFSIAPSGIHVDTASCSVLGRVGRTRSRRFGGRQWQRQRGQPRYGRRRGGNRCHWEWRPCWRSRERRRGRIRQRWQHASDGRCGCSRWSNRSRWPFIQRRQVGDGGHVSLRRGFGVGWNCECRWLGWQGRCGRFRRSLGVGWNHEYCRYIWQGRVDWFRRHGRDGRHVSVWPRPDG